MGTAAGAALPVLSRATTDTSQPCTASGYGGTAARYAVAVVSDTYTPVP